MHTNILLFIIFTFCINCCVCKKYFNYTLFRGIPNTRIHLQFFKNLSKNREVSFWRYPGFKHKPVDVVVSPSAKPDFLRQAKNLRLNLATSIEDLQKAFDMQTVKAYIRTNMDSFDWKNYYQLNDIYQWLRDLAKVNSEEMTLKSIGKTSEDRDILAVKITLKGAKSRSTVIVEGGIHAREWISPAFVTYFINQILKAPLSNNEALKKIALTYKWYFVPVLNPDGYEYSHKEDRNWRKNRQHGVDLNRNFDHGFGTIGATCNKDSETYCGPHAFSEKETSAMAAFVKAKSDDLEYYLAFHSYGQMLIIPYSDLKTREENYYEMKHKCMQAERKIRSKYYTQYTVGTFYETNGYLSSGTSGGWAKSHFRVPYVVSFELRDKGTYGYALPPDQIKPTCVETMEGVVALLTPQSVSFKKLREYPHSTGRAYNMKEDKIVIVFNVFSFILICFD